MAAAGVMEDHSYLALSLPTPTATPRRTPSRPRSRAMSQLGSSSPALSSPPPPLPTDQGWSMAPNPADNESISMLDPRRFTPTLHASLVSEILSLRRDLDSKRTLIEELEGGLGASRSEVETVKATLAGTSKEVRSLRRQLQLLEGGTASALDELTRERDEAVESVADMRRRLEASQKKGRAEEENAGRLQGLWDRDKQAWQEQRRHMERKVHVVEGRLKAILEEVAAQQAAKQARGQVESDEEGAGADVAFVDAVDPAAVQPFSSKECRPMSVMSAYTVRFSMQPGPDGQSRGEQLGRSLADELNMDDDDEQSQDGFEPPELKKPNPGEDDLEHSEQTFLIDSFEHRIKRITADASVQTDVDQSPNEVTSQPSTTFKRAANYVDTGSQFSAEAALPPPPLPSPKTGGTFQEAARSKSPEEGPSSGTDHEANQRRKRVAAHRSSVNVDMSRTEPPKPSPVMLTASSQTEEQRPTRPGDMPSSSSPSSDAPRPELSSTATQTDPPPIPPPTRAPPPPPIIPAITIIPPNSAPSSPGRPIFSPRIKHAACQVTLAGPTKMRSVSVQTEEIRIDKRTIKLPPHLLPASIRSTPNSPGLESKRRSSGSFKPSSPPKRASKRALGIRRSSDVPSSPPTAHAGFDIPTSDEGEDYEEEEEWNVSDFQTALSAPRPRSWSRRLAAASAVLHDKDPNVGFNGGGGGGGQPRSGESQPPTAANGHNRTAEMPLRRGTLGSGKLGGLAASHARRPGVARRMGPLAAASDPRVSRTGSPSVDQANDDPRNAPGPAPPFPVPTRFSSRRIPISASEGARSPRRHVSSIFGHGKVEMRRSPTKDGLRQMRSTTPVARYGRASRRGSRSPPPPSLSSTLASPTSPPLPPLPGDGAVAPPRPGYLRRGSSQDPPASTNTSQTGVASVDGAAAPNEIVDAIAQTMVGEWMWKYVRRRKSFGVSESARVTAADNGTLNAEASVATGNGIRHKRWVWLAPYERAVMWSSKQPTSGTALLGKNGRKLVIQSVLDVKDDTPAPRFTGARTAFDRSILILTPARALKFTATSRERHYVWLTALSFLSRPSLGAADLVGLPPLPAPELEAAAAARPPMAALRRHPIRDSIRVAKRKARSSSVRTESSSQLGSNNQALPGTLETVEGAGDPGALITVAVAAAADAPTVPRFSAHGRHRSNTGGAPPLGALRSFTQPVLPPPPSHPGLGAHLSPELRGSASLRTGTSGLSIGLDSQARRATSETSSATGLATSANFFDAVGTVRMEAFVRGASPSPGKGPDGLHGPSQPALHEDTWVRKPWNGLIASYDHRQPPSQHPHPPPPPHDGHRLQRSQASSRTDDPFRGF